MYCALYTCHVNILSLVTTKIELIYRFDLAKTEAALDALHVSGVNINTSVQTTGAG